MKIGLIRCLQIERDMLLDDSLFESYKRTCRSVSRYPFQTHVGIHHGRIRNTGPSSALRTATILFYLSNEGLSIVENAARMGLPIPDRLQEALKQLRK